jgi:Ras family protein
MIRIINEKLINFLGIEKVPRVIVGNKSDLLPSDRYIQNVFLFNGNLNRKVTREEADSLARELGCGFIECSGKLNENIGKNYHSCSQC